MSETKPGLVLHLVGAAQPLHIALDREEAESLAPLLPELMSSGEPRTLNTADGGRFTVNFTHVAAAHVDSVRSESMAYGAPARSAGFGG
ncbi:hypothetical protein FHX42_004874 [Saccharopolyspora lacisalsi]|uniref:Uncharacterized protein n=1 Tax=Halosaccharopolyspora lacisalsi TaxID=1000566 RepID=A0A839E9G1_9PSEU|nr:hypothetical protein [Halosaccharopolyspora lacisalsi]MBA8827478.1 hypothetical protein [Halosaccharopolyspora lacisalsi]